MRGRHPLAAHGQYTLEGPGERRADLQVSDMADELAGGDVPAGAEMGEGFEHPGGRADHIGPLADRFDRLLVILLPALGYAALGQRR